MALIEAHEFCKGHKFLPNLPLEGQLASIKGNVALIFFLVETQSSPEEEALGWPSNFTLTSATVIKDPDSGQWMVEKK